VRDPRDAFPGGAGGAFEHAKIFALGEHDVARIALRPLHKIIQGLHGSSSSAPERQPYA
jgi:hypothetical protein